jgi:hypothetical protein
VAFWAFARPCVGAVMADVWSYPERIALGRLALAVESVSSINAASSHVLLLLCEVFVGLQT